MVEYAQHVVSQGLTCHTGEKQKEEGEEQRDTGQQRKTGGAVMSQWVKELVQAW